MVRLTQSAILAGILATALVMNGCTGSSRGLGRRIAGSTCYTASNWIPNVPAVTHENSDAAVLLQRTEHTLRGALVGVAQPYVSREVQVEFDISDLGPEGSLTLLAEPRSMPTSLTGEFYPFLTSLRDSSGELIAMSPECAQTGIYVCNGGFCDPNPTCAVGGPGKMYQDFVDWEQHQLSFFGNISQNTLPTGFAITTRPRPGHYVARFALLAAHYETITFGHEAEFKVTALRKLDHQVKAGVELNVVFVGRENIQATQTEAGKRNLDILFGHVADQFRQQNSGIGLSAIRALDWECDNLGDAYAHLEIDRLGDLFSVGSAAVPLSSEGKSVNVFMVSDILDGTSSGILLGLAGAVGGPFLNGFSNSGVAVATFDRLAQLNPGCNESSCTLLQQEEDFLNLVTTVSHEVGHYLGLNHLTESDATISDPIADTPTCPIEPSLGRVTHSSCLSQQPCQTACPLYGYNGPFCPTAAECGFNHVMWWTIKRYFAGSGDGNLFSQHSGSVLRAHPVVQ